MVKEKGAVYLVLPLIFVIILAIGVIYLRLKPLFIPSEIIPSPKISVHVTAIPTVSPSPTLTPTSAPIPTSTSTPTPVVTVSIIPTKKPTSPPVVGPVGAGFSSINVATDKGNFQASVLAIDLNGAKMVTDTASDNECSNDCPVRSLADFVTRNNGFAGVNGTYFCPDSYPECSGKKNTFDFPVYNTRLGHWVNQGNLFWDFRAIVYFDGSGAHYLQNAKDFNGGLTAGIVNYPGLLSGGNVQIDDNQSGLSDKQKIKNTKVGIGVRDNKNVMIVMAQNVNMQEFAYVFKSLGANGALNLDTGGSTALYYNGSYLAGPGRNLPNAIIFTR